MKTGKQTEQLIKKAVQGSKEALEEIVRRIQQPVAYPEVMGQIGLIPWRTFNSYFDPAVFVYW